MVRKVPVDNAIMDMADVVVVQDLHVGTANLFDPDTGESPGNLLLLRITPFKGEEVNIGLSAEMGVRLLQQWVSNMYEYSVPERRVLISLMLLEISATWLKGGDD